MVLGEVTRLTEQPVVLETLAHEVLAYDAAGTDPAELLSGWPARSRVVQLGERTGYHASAGWLVTVVGARGHDWGRLVVVCAEPPPHRYHRNSQTVRHFLRRILHHIAQQARLPQIYRQLRNRIRQLPADFPPRVLLLRVLVARRNPAAPDRPHSGARRRPRSFAPAVDKSAQGQKRPP